MTKNEILAAIAASPSLQAMRDAGNHQGIADALSVGRTKIVPFYAGKGDVINTIGFTAGNALCDFIDSHPDFRHVKHLLTDGKLGLHLPTSQGALAGVVAGGVITGEQANALLALATAPDPIQHQAVSAALRGE